MNSIEDNQRCFLHLPPMTLTTEQSQWLRAKLLSDLDKDTSVDIDARFIRNLFGDDITMELWAKSWNLEVSRYSIPKGRQGAVQFVSFTKPPVPLPETMVEDEEL